MMEIATIPVLVFVQLNPNEWKYFYFQVIWKIIILLSQLKSITGTFGLVHIKSYASNSNTCENRCLIGMVSPDLRVFEKEGCSNVE